MNQFIMNCLPWHHGPPYLVGPWCHGPPLERQDSTISIELYAKLRHGPPLCNLGRKFEHTKGTESG